MSRLLRTVAMGLLLMGGASAFATPTRATQFVLIDVTFTMTQEEGMKNQSHYYVRGDKLGPDRPKDWTSPVDYRNGSVHIRTEVLEKPEGGEITTWSLCYIPNKGQKNNYGCTNIGYEGSEKAASFSDFARQYL